MSKTAIVDIDNTLWQFSDAFYRELKKINEHFPSPADWRRYDIWEGYCSLATFREAIGRVHHDQDSDRHQPYPEARAFLRSLRAQGFYVIIASHRSPETLPPTEKWLMRHGLDYDELHLSFDKTVLFSRAAVVVDDSPATLEKAVAGGVLGTGLLFPWNRACAGNGFRLFENLDEVRDYILEVNPGR
ncbi:MAG: hypothetical protein M0009_08570 [Deltaproteobacteria bacterium]|nr:hypothetical protein [Deltaproteobacteria bacterium]